MIFVTVGTHEQPFNRLVEYMDGRDRYRLATETIDLGRFGSDGMFQSVKTLQISQKEYEIFLTDIIYTDPCNDSGGKAKLTLGDEHVTADESVLDDPGVFHKNYAWKYEKECRLVVRLSEKWKMEAAKNNLTQIRIVIPGRIMRKVDEKRLVRSPIYRGKCSYGIKSQLAEGVKWDLTRHHS